MSKILGHLWPDWHLIAEYLAQHADHYVGYYSALQIHNLITQPTLKEQIVVSKQIRPSKNSRPQYHLFSQHDEDRPRYF